MRSHKVVWIGLAFLLLAFRTTILLLSSTGGLSGDGPGYLGVAVHLTQTGTLPPLRFQPHGYPILISPIVAAFNERPAVAVQVVQALLDAGLVASLSVIAWKTLARYSVLVAGLMTVAVIIQPFTATLADSLYTETANTILLTASLLLFARSYIKGKVPIAASFVLGLAATTRVELIPLAVALSAAYWLIISAGERAPPLWSSSRLIKAFIMLVAMSIPLVSLVALQTVSTGEAGVVRYEPYNPGYYAWMRTWFSNEKEYARFGFGVGRDGWEGFRLEAYPRRAFADNEERARIADLLKKWQAEGYTPEVDRAFAAIYETKRTRAPANYFFIIPPMRMAHYWINLDGAQSLLRAVNIKRPYSLGIVGITITLRVIFILFAVIGAATVWIPQLACYLPPFLRALGQAASIIVTLRTVELGALGTIVSGGLMEIRYANITFPAVILLAIVGARTLAVRMHAGPPISGSPASGREQLPNDPD
jgi:hypothetical protein